MAATTTTRQRTSQPPVRSPLLEVVRRVSRTVWLVATRIGAFLVLFQLYKLVRKTFIQRAERVAFDHAEQILGLCQSRVGGLGTRLGNPRSASDGG